MLFRALRVAVAWTLFYFVFASFVQMFHRVWLDDMSSLCLQMKEKISCIIYFVKINDNNCVNNPIFCLRIFRTQEQFDWFVLLPITITIEIAFIFTTHAKNAPPMSRLEWMRSFYDYQQKWFEHPSHAKATYERLHSRKNYIEIILLL